MCQSHVGNCMHTWEKLKNKLRMRALFPVLFLRNCARIFKGTERMRNQTPTEHTCRLICLNPSIYYKWKIDCLPKCVQTHTTGMATASTWKGKFGTGREVSEAAAGFCWAVLWAITVPAAGFLSMRWKKPTCHCLRFQLGASLMLTILL